MDQQQFARALANPDKGIRDRTVRELKKFLAGASSIDDKEMLKLWKALFYCLWLADKAPVQEELCKSIADMLEVFKKPSLAFGKYLKMFFRIMLMEWDMLDQHRLNKFYTLIRVMLGKCFEMLKNINWAEKTTNRYLEAITIEVLVKRPNGPRYHICDIYLEELWNATEGNICHDDFMVAISPFFRCLGTTDDPMFRSRLSDKIFKNFIENYARENRQSDFDLKLFDKVSTLCLQREIFDIASHESEEICVDVNRRSAYDLHGVFARCTHVRNVSDEDCESDLEKINSVANGNGISVNKDKKLKTPDKKNSKRKSSTSDHEAAGNGVDLSATKNKSKKRSRVETVTEAEEPTPESDILPQEILPPCPFIASKKYTGAKPGYSFKKGKQGQGYYLDKKHPGYNSLTGVDKKTKSKKQLALNGSTPSTASKRAKKREQDRIDEENRRVRFGQNIAKDYQESVKSLKSTNPDLSNTPSKSAIRTPVKTSSTKKAKRTDSLSAQKGKSSGSPRAKASSYF